MIKINLGFENSSIVIANILKKIPPSIELNVTQLIHLSTYLELVDRYQNKLSDTLVVNKTFPALILHAVNYDHDDNNNYWAVLSNEFYFMDLSIPHIVNLNDITVSDNMNEKELDIFKSLRDYLKDY